MRNKRDINNIYIHYRISDNGFKNKIKPSYITKYNCLKNALDTFKGDNVYFKVYVDSVIPITEKMIHDLCDYRENTEIIKIDIHSNGFSFRRVYEDACKLEDNDLVYFLEDDYIHQENALEYLKDAAEWNYTDYISLYDHPDKYDNNEAGVNPLAKEFGEITKVFKTSNHHWKLTNSTTMTFAAFVDVLKRDKEIFWKYTETGYPYDYNIFINLLKEGKFLSSPIPSISTHGETKFLAPFIEWKKIAKRKTCCIVIVTHKETLDGKDEISFKRCLEVFGGKRDIKLILPDNITTTYYEEYTNVLEIVKVNNKWLSSLKEYNAMCCNQEFYELFKDYEYVLIYQTDCWVFEDRLDYFIGLGYEYYGAPWVHNNDMVGNGGLSLRKVSKMIEITNKYEFKGESLEGAEDTWFSITHKDEINICPLDVACQFSIENPVKKYLEKVNNLPMCLHGRNAYKLWDNDGSKFLKLKG
jgi:hypothetical protein